MSEVKHTAPDSFVEQLDLRFSSGNEHPVTVARIKSDEWAAIKGLLTRQAARCAQLEEALTWAVKEIDRNTCQHTETYRGGAIWTICRDCDKKWADDEGGFKRYREPKELKAARSALSAPKEQPT